MIAVVESRSKVFAVCFFQAECFFIAVPFFPIDALWQDCTFYPAGIRSWDTVDIRTGIVIVIADIGCFIHTNDTVSSWIFSILTGRAFDLRVQCDAMINSSFV